MTHGESVTTLLHFVKAYADFAEQCAKYQWQALLKQEAELYDDGMEIFEVPKKKRKV